jgi:hypothetical protein
MIDPDQPLATDPTTPLITDFKPHELNQIYRHIPVVQQAVHQDNVLVMAG